VFLQHLQELHVLCCWRCCKNTLV